ncbi:YjiH family protein [Thalassospira sp. TSL5-1]|uniref:YjiH family protein n=1 Tax=Thalassospira sp. TSL5-1 TaxID=1544451 RepID=UPI00093F4FC8|nr:YjiH family protein [Thalassospira sp. TSL5-1]OKH86973.1 histidine transporter [Thalassospira sp. TSL5-1]
MSSNDNSAVAGPSAANMGRLLGLSAIGIFIFFIPITIDGKSSIPLDHMVGFLRGIMGPAAGYYALAMIWVGAAYPFVKGTWKNTTTDKVFSVLKLLGAVTAVLALTGWGPEALQSKDMLPFLFNKLVISVGLIVPIGAVFLALLVSYGLLEFIGVFLQPVMRPIWKTPGRSAIDAVASFVGSYSIGLLITNRVYKAGQYSAREAAVIATGFSTVSATFMIIVAKTLNLMDIWNQYFWLTLVITFVVTAITVRIPPLVGMDDHARDPEPDVPSGERVRTAWQSGLEVAHNAPGLLENIKLNLREGLLMTISILPSIMSVGLIGLLLAKYTPVFDWLGYVFYPFTAIFGIDGAAELAKASATGLAEMFLPALILGDASFVVRFAAGVVSVSGVLFFSASIPCILSTEIPIGVGRLVIVWFLRVALSLLLAIPAAMLIGS